jgi:lipopolysaccharide export system permease protein
MRILRRHILRTFRTPWIYILLAFVFIYVIYDLFDHLSDFVNAKAPLTRVALYYAWLMPSVAWILLPVSLMLATLYALFQLTRNNEITALKASGISLTRAVSPLLAVGVGASLVLAVIEQTVAPRAAQWTDNYLRSLDQRGRITANQKVDVPYFSPRLRHNWRIRMMDVKTFDLEGVVIEVLRPSNLKEREIRAERAAWRDRQWHLSEVEVRHFDAEGLPSPRYDAEGNRLPQTERMETLTLGRPEFPERPEDILNTFTKAEHLSSWAMLEYLRQHPGVTNRTRAEYLTNLHFKLATPWACLVVVLLGIPFGNATARKGAMIGVVLCLSLFFSYYILIIFCKILGHRQALHPALAAWAPNLLLGALGIWQIRRVR